MKIFKVKSSLNLPSISKQSSIKLLKIISIWLLRNIKKLHKLTYVLFYIREQWQDKNFINDALEIKEVGGEFVLNWRLIGNRKDFSQNFAMFVFSFVLQSFNKSHCTIKAKSKKNYRRDFAPLNPIKFLLHFKQQ